MTINRATRLIVLCRGATPASRQLLFSSDEPLIPKDVERSRSIAHTLGNFDTILFAPEIAAAQTAAAFPGPAISCDALRDVDYGQWNNRTFADVSEQSPQEMALWLSDPTAAPHGGESFKQAQARAASWLHSLHARGGNILAVTHSIVLKLLFADVVGAPLTSIWRIDAEPMTMLGLTSDGKRWALRSFGPRTVFDTKFQE